jgi:hypothetical protein
MVAFTETEIAMAFAVLGVVGTIVWYGIAYYGIKTLRDVRDAVGNGNSS